MAGGRRAALPTYRLDAVHGGGEHTGGAVMSHSFQRAKRKWRPVGAGRRKNHSIRSVTQRIANVKNALSPVLFYLDELPGLELRRDHGWQDGGLCPFHNDRRAGSFKINLDTGAFKCFSCNTAGGDILGFYRLRYCTDFMTALRDLEARGL